VAEEWYGHERDEGGGAHRVDQELALEFERGDAVRVDENREHIERRLLGQPQQGVQGSAQCRAGC
jgi:hypothetical protein